MSDCKDLLIEIGTEELPPKALGRLADAFHQGFKEGLDGLGLSYQAIDQFATPRRLALRVNALQSVQSDKAIERKGPAVQAAFDDDGNPTKAAQGFARSCGVEVGELEQVEGAKGAWLVFRSTRKGEETANLVPELLKKALARLPIPKYMRWGDLNEEFVRPVHWLVVLFGDQVIDTTLFGVTAGNQSRGHRFHRPQSITIASPASYQESLREQGMVVADFNERRALVERQVIAAAEAAGGRAEIDPDLLDEVTALVEWPSAVVGTFEERFLAVPAEALVSAMKGHQKYFHMVDGEGRLLPNFITKALQPFRSILSHIFSFFSITPKLLGVLIR